MQQQINIPRNRAVIIWHTGVTARWFKNMWMGSRGIDNPVVAFLDDKPISYFQNGVDGIQIITPDKLLSVYNDAQRPFVFLPDDQRYAERHAQLIKGGLAPGQDFAQYPKAPDYTLDWLAFYPDWATALLDTAGYEHTTSIEETVREAHELRRVPPSYDIAYSDQRLFTPFMTINDFLPETLRVVDFGGALGGHYLRFKAFLPNRKFDWCVWETETMARAGQEHFKNNELHFVSNREQITSQVDIVVATGSIQYVDDSEKYYELLNSLKPQFMLFDRTPLTPWQEDRILVQRVFRNTPAGSFETSYPSRFLSTELWQKRFERDYKIVMKWPDTHDIVEVAGERIVYSGVLLQRR